MRLRHPARFYGPLIAGAAVVLFVSFVAVSMSAEESCPRPGEQLWSEVKAALLPATRVLPAGTLLEVRLSRWSGREETKTGRFFRGTLEENVVSGRRILVPRGSRVTGFVEEAEESGDRGGHPSFFLSLSSIHVAGREHEVFVHPLIIGERRSSIDGVGALPEYGQVGEVKSGMRLGFLLSQPLTLTTAGED